MTTIAITSFVPVAASSSADVVSTPVIPTVSSYGVWYSAGSCTWTPALGDVITITGWVVTNTSSIVCTTGQELAISARARLYDTVETADVWSGTFEQQILRVQGANVYGNPKTVTSFNHTFDATDLGLLRPGRGYVLYIEVRKSIVSGTPTCALTVIDSTIYSDTAAVFPVLNRPRN